MSQRDTDTDIDRSRMQYWLKEMKDKYSKYPDSLVLKNGIAAIEYRLGISESFTPVDPIELVNRLTTKLTNELTR